MRDAPGVMPGRGASAVVPQLFEQLAETLPEENEPNEKSIFEKVKDYFV